MFIIKIPNVPSSAVANDDQDDLVTLRERVLLLESELQTLRASRTTPFVTNFSFLHSDIKEKITALAGKFCFVFISFFALFSFIFLLLFKFFH